MYNNDIDRDYEMWLDAQWYEYVHYACGLWYALVGDD